MGCGYPGAPAHSYIRFTGDSLDHVLDEEESLIKDSAFPEGTVATYYCERGFELLGPARRRCQMDSTWTPEGVPFCGKSKFDFYKQYINNKKYCPSYAYTCIHLFTLTYFS